MSQEVNEREQRNGKGRGKGILILLLLLILAALVYFGGIGLGLWNSGWSSGTSETDKGTVQEQSSAQDAQSSQQDEQSSADETQEIKTVEVTVSGNKYIYQNRETALDDLMQQLTGLGKDVKISVRDDNASLDAFKALTDKLDQNGLAHLEQ